MTRIEIIEAFENTKYFNKMYWIKTLNQRAGLLPNGAMNPNRAGSYYPNHSSPSLSMPMIVHMLHHPRLRPMKTAALSCFNLHFFVKMRDADFHQSRCL